MQLKGKKWGQATAVGAVFFILILGIVLGYLFYFINQVENLNKVALSTIQERYEKQKEQLDIESVDYLETKLIDYNPESIEVVYGTKISDSPLIIESMITGGGGGGEESIVLVDANSAWDYAYGSYDGFSCPRGRCSFELKLINGYIGAEAYINLRNVFWIWKIGDGYWYAPFNFPKDVDISSLSLSISYRVESVNFVASSGFVRWNFSVLIVNESGHVIYWHSLNNVTHRNVRYDSFTLTLNDIPVNIFVPGERYYLKVYAYVEIFLFAAITPPLSFFRIVYDGKVYFDKVRLEAYYKGGFGSGGGIGKAGVVFGFNLNGGTPLSLKAELEVNTTPVELAFYYEYSGGVWRKFESYIIKTTSTVNVDLPIPEEARNNTNYMIIANAGGGFKLTIYGFKLNCSYIADNLNVTLVNERGETAKIVSFWIINASKVWRSDLNVALAPLEKRTIQINYRVERGTRYLIRIVTEKGNVFDYYISIP